MLIRAGYEISLICDELPMMALISVHPSRAQDLRTPGLITANHGSPLCASLDEFGNLRTRTTVPMSTVTFSTDFVIADSGLPDEVAPWAGQCPVSQVPEDALRFLIGSRYCETDRLSPIAWSLFANTTPGYPRVQAIVNYVHQRLTFGYQYANSMRTAWDAHEQRVGVCRDFAHLSVAFCRAMNIPARYCTGYLGDIGVPVSSAPMDFSAWFEAYLGDRWYTFDARHNTPRIGRILMARGRDAADVALTTTFGFSRLVKFNVHTFEVDEILSSMKAA
jgi:transglutaminase-like putative cysteine protease